MFSFFKKAYVKIKIKSGEKKMGRKHIKNRVYQRTERKIFNALANISKDKSLAEIQICELVRVAKIAE
ncbi:hypothetical protein HG462_003745, partial [Candidatus Saccharibacteria bacterium]|nr:hypothetical protein [Candidatus Saccharibacteria bacterium]